jgi:hypothetical protein
MAEWRVGLGRWEFATQLLPTLTDGTACNLSMWPAASAAPPGTTDLDMTVPARSIVLVER